MHASEAIKIISEATWRPGVKVIAVEPFGYVRGHYGEEILLEIVFDTYDSDPQYLTEDGKYTRKINVGPQTALNVGNLDEGQLLFKILEFISFAQQHEDREFLRVKRNGKWIAPFHPHRNDGERLWARQGRGEAPDTEEFAEFLRILNL